MNPRILLNIVLAVFLAILITVTIYEPGKEKAPHATVLTDLAPSEVFTISIEQPQQKRILLQKKANNWEMQEPIVVAANDVLIDNLLGITSTPTHASYQPSGLDLQQLGLKDPDLTITLNDSKLFFGDTDALRGFRYVLSDNRIHLITDRFTHKLRGSYTDFVNPALLPANTTLTKLVLPEITLQSGENGWRLTPDNIKASADQIQQLLDEWRFARAIQVSQVSKMHQSPITEKSMSITVQTKNAGDYAFSLQKTTDEMILTREDVGLRYHFDEQSGEKLLGFHQSGFETKDTD